MSGFIGLVSNKNVKNAILKALKILQFNDDDSTGVLFCGEKVFDVHRVVGKVDDLIPLIPSDADGTLGIGHTRWSTYTTHYLKNVYPIMSQNKKVSLIIHGLIDNVIPLRRKLIKRGFQFKTDSAIEVVANLIEENMAKGQNSLKALSEALLSLEGSYAVLAVFVDDPDRIYFAKNVIPVIIGKNEDSMMITTDFPPIADLATEYYYPKDKEIGYVTKDSLHVFNINLEAVDHEFTHTSISEETLELGDYPHYMLKEIEEAPRVIKRLVNQYFDGTKYKFDDKLIQRILDADNIIFIAAGTSHNAALIGQRYLRNFNKKVDVFIASEWHFYPYQSGDNPLYVLISQSGETSDVLKCLDVIDSYGGDVLAITNTEVSTLYQRADYRLLLHAGTEVSVASTKAYIAQITLLTLLYARLANKVTTISALDKVIKSIEELIKSRDVIKQIAQDVAKYKDVYFLGRGFDYDVAIEAQLKLKETTYIHSEAYAGGEVLHGPIALVDKGMPVVVFVSDAIAVEAMREVIVELEKREANVIVCSATPFSVESDRFSTKTIVKVYHSPIVFAVFAQYLAYYTAVALGRNVDRPRNLSKAVKDRDVQ